MSLAPLKRLGRDRGRYAYPGSGTVGTLCEARLRTDDGLDPLVIPTQALTRVILTVRTRSGAEQTAFFDPDPAITSDEAEQMHRSIEEALRGDVEALTLSGSSPSTATHGLYSDLISLAQARQPHPSSTPTAPPSMPSEDIADTAVRSTAGEATALSARRPFRTTTRPGYSRNGTGTA